MSSLPSLIRHASATPVRLAVAALCLLALVFAGARLLGSGPTQTATVLRPLNVRAGPGTEHPVVGHAGEGSRIRIARSDDRGWAAVRRGSRTIGYVRALPQYVSVADGSGSSALPVWLLIGVVAAGAGMVVARDRARQRAAPAAPAPLGAFGPADDITLTAPRPASAATPVAPPPIRRAERPAPAPGGGETESERNGRGFEDWAAVRVKQSGLHLLDWRSDKYVAGVFAESTLNPDLVVEHRGGAQPVRFAVECKWRRRYWDDALHWGKHEHLRRYRKYAADQQIPVYLLLGVGGTGAEPREVYLVPLDGVRFTRLYFRELRGWDRVNGDGRFAVDVANRKLRLLPTHS